MVLIFTLGLTTAFGILPMLAYGVAHGFRPQLWLAAIPAFYLAATFTALLLVVSYAWFLRFVGARRLSRLLSYAQLLIGLVVYSAYLLPGEISRSAGRSSCRTPVAPALPADVVRQLSLDCERVGRVASLVIRRGVSRGDRAAGAGPGRPAVARLRRAARGTDRRRGAAPARHGRRPWLFRAGRIARRVALVLAQFRNDQKFRMGGVRRASDDRSFTCSCRSATACRPIRCPGRMNVQGWNLISMAVLFFPMMVRLA
jgi:hypothetical protein